MAKKPPGSTRREFLRDAAVAAGGAALAGALPAIPAFAQGAKASEPKLGAQLIGKLEGPELILDHAKWQRSFTGSEASVADVTDNVMRGWGGAAPLPPDAKGE